MKVITLESRIAKSNNKNGSTPNNSKYTTALKFLVSNGNKIHFNFTTGRGKYTKVASNNPADYLEAWGIDFEYGNDAPRGGQLGEYIQLTSKGKRQCKAYYEQYLLEKEASNKRLAEIDAKIKAKKEADLIEFNKLVALIDKVEGEDHSVTAGRLKVALNGKELDKKTFYKVVSAIRKK